MPLATLFAVTLTVSQPRIPAGGPGGNIQDAAIAIAADRATTSRIAATLDAPPATPLLSTGFPYTEGTRLWSIASDGPVLRLRYLFPMRGTYTLAAVATLHSGAEISATQAVAVPEDPRVLRTLAIFVAGLLTLGAAAGYLLAAGIPLGGVVRHAATIVLLAALCGPALSMQMSTADDAAHPKTGTLWPLRASVSGPAVFDVEARNVEDGKPLIAATLPARNGRLNVSLQFYDGAQHEVRIRASRAGKLLRTWTQSIDVVAQPPPLSRRIVALVWMLCIVAIGYVSGTSLRLRRTRYR